MIHALLQYAEDRGLVSKPGYARKTVKWVLDFDQSGTQFTGLVPSDRPFDAAPDLTQPELLALASQRGQAAHFLVAPLGSFLGWGKDEAAEHKERARQETILWMLKEAGKVDATFDTLSTTLMDEETKRNMRDKALEFKRPAAKPTDLATIRVGDRFPADETSWHAWWDSFRTALKKPAAGQALMACFGTGDLVIPETTHPKLKKLSGVGLSQPHAPIVTFDKQAFESYGLNQGENAAMSSATAQAYVGAIDHLLENSVVYSWKRTKQAAPKELQPNEAKIAGARIAYWYLGSSTARVEVEEHNDLIAVLLGSSNTTEPLSEDQDEERVLVESRLRRTIERVRLGGQAQPIGNVRFCVLVLSRAGGRVMVRDFLEGTVLHLAETTERWFEDLSLDSYWGRTGHSPSLEHVLTAPLPERRRDQDYGKWVAPAGAWRQALWRAALTGTKIPDSAFERSLLCHNNTVITGELTDNVIGSRAQSRSRLRLALAKAHLIRKGITMKPALDPEHPSPAYHCGRLLAAYDSLQRAALGDVGAGVVQRFYGGALTNPSGVFGQLSRMAQTHLSKLEGGLCHVYEGRIAEIHNGINRQGDLPVSFPAALSLDDQALFALGFWHQVAATNREIAEASAAKKAREGVAKNSQPNKGGE